MVEASWVTYFFVVGYGLFVLSDIVKSGEDIDVGDVLLLFLAIVFWPLTVVASVAVILIAALILFWVFVFRALREMK